MKLLELNGITGFPVFSGDERLSTISYLTETRSGKTYHWAIDGVTEAEARGTFEKYLLETA